MSEKRYEEARNDLFSKITLEVIRGRGLEGWPKTFSDILTSSGTLEAFTEAMGRKTEQLIELHESGPTQYIVNVAKRNANCWRCKTQIQKGSMRVSFDNYYFDKHTTRHLCPLCGAVRIAARLRELVREAKEMMSALEQLTLSSMKEISTDAGVC